MTSSSLYDVIKLVIFVIFAFFLRFLGFVTHVTSTFFEIEQQTDAILKGSRLECNFGTVKTLSYDDIITLRRPKVGT